MNMKRGNGSAAHESKRTNFMKCDDSRLTFRLWAPTALCMNLQMPYLCGLLRTEGGIECKPRGLHTKAFITRETFVMIFSRRRPERKTFSYVMIITG